ncbi:2-oxoglutarate and iron-dependent oxygenase domain-containing protein 3-like protein, partial [Dinothrombium tinctorium]
MVYKICRKNNRENSKFINGSKSQQLKKFDKFEAIVKNLNVAIVSIGLIYLFVPWTHWISKSLQNRNQESFNGLNFQLFASANEFISGIRFHHVNCSVKGYRREKELNVAPLHCGTMVSDMIIDAHEALKLRDLVKISIQSIGYSRKNYPESLNIKRVRLYEIFVRGERKGFFNESHFEIIKKVSEIVKRAVSLTFGLPEQKLFFAPISEATRFKSVTEFQEFRHVDKVRAPTLVVTSIIWLSTSGDHFTGGELEFLTDSPILLEPKLGRFAAWTSSYENPHAVREMKD